ncbi:hypothetical protein ES708_22619 [subsurface metagenome]
MSCPDICLQIKQKNSKFTIFNISPSLSLYVSLSPSQTLPCLRILRRAGRQVFKTLAGLTHSSPVEIAPTLMKCFRTSNFTPTQSFPVKYCPPCVIALHHFVDYTEQAISQGKLPCGAGRASIAFHPVG